MFSAKQGHSWYHYYIVPTVLCFFYQQRLYGVFVKLDLKLGYTTKTAMHRQCVTCFRNVAIHIIAVLRTLHSLKENAFVVLC